MVEFSAFQFVIISVPECRTLETTWSHVVTRPALPIQLLLVITLSCAADQVNKGGSKATCQNGRIVPTTTPPQCSFIGKFTFRVFPLPTPYLKDPQIFAAVNQIEYAGIKNLRKKLRL